LVTCWKVVKTYEWGAARLDTCLSRCDNDGAVREENQEVSGFPAR